VMLLLVERSGVLLDTAASTVLLTWRCCDAALGGALRRAARHCGLNSASDLAVLLLVGNLGVLPHLAPSTVLPSIGAASGGAPTSACFSTRRPPRYCPELQPIS